MIFTGNIARWRRSTDSCESNGGRCIDTNDINDLCSDDYSRVRRDYACFKANGEIDKNKVCCVST
jgi:hypothetical protein